MSKFTGAYTVQLAGVDGAGGVLSVKNPEDVDLYVTRLILNVTTKSTGAATIDAGIAANGTTSADNLVDGLDVGAAAGVFDSLKNPGTNGKAGQKWAAGAYLTISKATGAAAGLVGQALVEYVHLG